MHNNRGNCHFVQKKMLFYKKKCIDRCIINYIIHIYETFHL